MDGEVVKKTPPRRTRWREGAAWRRDRAETAAKSLKQPQHQNMRVAARATRRALLGRAPPARLCNGAASDERAALLRRIRSLPPGEREQLLASVAELPAAAAGAADAAGAAGAAPSSAQLRALFIATAAPMVGFGFVDNAIMIAAGEVLEVQLGAAFCLSTLAAAGLGNLISDVVGLSAGGAIESAAERAGLSAAAASLSAAQAASRAAYYTRGTAAVLGISAGCLLGMFPLLFYSEDDARLRKIFVRYDLDGDGTIDRAELRRAFADARTPTSEAQIELLFSKFDADGSGALDFGEFKAFIQHIESEAKTDTKLEARNFMRSAHVISRRETILTPASEIKRDGDKPKS